MTAPHSARNSALVGVNWYSNLLLQVRRTVRYEVSFDEILRNKEMSNGFWNNSVRYTFRHLTSVPTQKITLQILCSLASFLTAWRVVYVAFREAKVSEVLHKSTCVERIKVNFYMIFRRNLKRSERQKLKIPPKLFRKTWILFERPKFSKKSMPIWRFCQHDFHVPTSTDANAGRSYFNNLFFWGTQLFIGNILRKIRDHSVEEI